MPRTTIAALALFLFSLASTAAERRILFVGNSYLFVNNVPELVRALAVREAPDAQPPHVDMLVAGGISLAQILEQDSIPGVFADGRYDTVVLQERGGLLMCLSGAQRPRPPECSESIDAHRKLAKLARKHGATRVVVYGTWSMSENMQGPVSRGTRFVANVVKGPAVDVGAMLEVAARTTDLPLFSSDKHLRAAGATLAAIGLYEAIYERRVSPGAFRAEIPVWQGYVDFSPRRPVARQRRAPKPEPATFTFDEREFGALLDAAHR